MKHLKTLRVRFALWTAGFLLATLLLFGVFVYASMSRSLVTPVDETLRLSAMQLLGEVAVRGGQLLVMENPFEDEEYAQLREQGLSMRVVAQGGQVVEQYGPYGDLPELWTANPDPNNPGEFATMTHPRSKDTVRVFAVPVTSDGRTAGTLQVAQSLSNVRDTLNLLMGTLLIGGPLMVLLAGAGGYFLAGRGLAPIDKITRTARTYLPATYRHGSICRRLKMRWGAWRLHLIPCWTGWTAPSKGNGASSPTYRTSCARRCQQCI